MKIINAFPFHGRNNTSDPPEVKLLEHVIQELELIFHPGHYLILQASIEYLYFYTLFLAEDLHKQSTLAKIAKKGEGKLESQGFGM